MDNVYAYGNSEEILGRPVEMCQAAEAKEEIPFRPDGRERISSNS